MMESLYSQKEVDALREKIARKEARAEGIGIGEAKGVIALCKLVVSKIISKEKAAELLGKTLAEFEKDYKKFAKSSRIYKVG